MIYNEWFRDEFQFTRPQGARHNKVFGYQERYAVSIHAPARGATGKRENAVAEIKFQFTRPQGARPFAITQTDITRVFQFTRPQGARLDFIAIGIVIYIVSIHAPARGATSPPTISPPNLLPFQFTRPQGARRQSVAY